MLAEIARRHTPAREFGFVDPTNAFVIDDDDRSVAELGDLHRLPVGHRTSVGRAREFGVRAVETDTESTIGAEDIDRVARGQYRQVGVGCTSDHTSIGALLAAESD